MDSTLSPTEAGIPDARVVSPAVILSTSSSSSSLVQLPENKKDSPTKASRPNRSASSGSIVKQSPSEIKASPTADILVKSSSSSSLLALAENKKDSPTKSQLKQRGSSGSITKRSPRASPTSSLLLAENKKDSPTKSSKQQKAAVEEAVSKEAEEPKSSDTATILESLATAEKEKEQQATVMKSSEGLADKQPNTGTQEETSSAAAVVSTTSEPKSESAMEPKKRRATTAYSSKGRHDYHCYCCRYSFNNISNENGNQDSRKYKGQSKDSR
jgi:hypothetical protein